MFSTVKELRQTYVDLNKKKKKLRPGILIKAKTRLGTGANNLVELRKSKINTVKKKNISRRNLSNDSATQADKLIAKLKKEGHIVSQPEIKPINKKLSIGELSVKTSKIAPDQSKAEVLKGASKTIEKKINDKRSKEKCF